MTRFSAVTIIHGRSLAARVGASALALIAVVFAAAAPTAGAAAPAAACQPYSGKPCLFPFPDNRLTRADHTSATGLRINLPAAAMPVNKSGVRVSAKPYDRNDGFSPGSSIVLHIAGLDNAAALAKTGVPQLLNLQTAYAKNAPIVVIDQATGKRQLLWAELDANAPNAANTDLLIHAGADFLDGHTYVVALRDLKTSGGKLIKAPKWFAALRAGGRLPAAERGQKQRYVQIFKALKKAGIKLNKTLYEAWNFTVGSRQSLTGPMLAIRNAAFAQLGDHNLADGVVSGNAPQFQVTSTSALSSDVPGSTFTQVNGTYQVPCYLITCGASAQPGFHYSSSKPGALPTQIPGNVATTNFECIVPSEATPSHPARISLYGHGLLGSADEVTDSWVQDLAANYDMVFCSTDFWGLAENDTLNDAAALNNLNLFPAVIDRLQQGALNSLFLGRVLLNPNGFAKDPAFQQGGQPVISTSHLYYDGNSQGGIMGGFLTAVAPDWNRAVLGVTGIDYANLLVQRSTDFAPFGALLYAAYPDASSHPLVLDLMEQLWDRGDPDGYAQYMTTHTLPGTPSHQVLMQIAYGDHQVSMYSAAVEARTIGASAYQPALTLTTDRSRDKNLFFGLPSIGHFPFSGSAIEVWDSGPGHTTPPPTVNLPPVDSATNQDPHSDPRKTPQAQLQVSDFLMPGGTVANVCGGLPCHSFDYTP